MKSNCARFAWDEYRIDPRHQWLCLQASHYSKWPGKIPRPIRRAAQFLIRGWLHVFTWLHILAFERWAHFRVCDNALTECAEFMPNGMKDRRYIPPYEFEGHVKNTKL